MSVRVCSTPSWKLVVAPLAMPVRTAESLHFSNLPCRSHPLVGPSSCGPATASGRLAASSCRRRNRQRPFDD
jgi:hypothetical protein